MGNCPREGSLWVFWDVRFGYHCRGWGVGVLRFLGCWSFGVWGVAAGAMSCSMGVVQHGVQYGVLGAMPCDVGCRTPRYGMRCPVRTAMRCGVQYGVKHTALWGAMQGDGCTHSALGCGGGPGCHALRHGVHRVQCGVLGAHTSLWGAGGCWFPCPVLCGAAGAPPPPPTRSAHSPGGATREVPPGVTHPRRAGRFSRAVRRCRGRGGRQSGGMGAPRGLWGLWLPWLCLRLLPGAAFNLDAASSLLKDGDKGSLFGVAVALHRQLSPEPAGW